MYWLVRMLAAGEDPRFLARRMVILAGEDVGLADPNALSVAVAAFAALDVVGLPEARYALAEAALYLALAPKSATVTRALARADAAVTRLGNVAVPAPCATPRRGRAPRSAPARATATRTTTRAAGSSSATCPMDSNRARSTSPASTAPSQSCNGGGAPAGPRGRDSAWGGIACARMDAVILAGGRGTRLRPLTDTRPKPLVPFAGDPFAAGLLRRLAAAGCRRATFLVGADPAPFAPLERLGEALGLPVAVVAEPSPLDTAGAARDLVRATASGPVVVCNGDILTDLDYAALIAAHDAAGATATLALTRVEDTSSFGVVVCDDAARVRRFVEKPPRGTVAADTVNAGTYVLAPDAFEGCPASGPLSFERAVFPGLVEAGAPVLGVAADAFWLDLGTPQRYLAGHRAVLSGRCAWPLGAQFARHGEASLVAASAAVDAAATVGPHVVVGPHAVVAAGAQVRGAALFEHVVVGAGAHVSDAVVGEHARVAPGARVPPGTVVAPGATVT